VLEGGKLKSPKPRETRRGEKNISSAGDLKGDIETSAQNTPWKKGRDPHTRKKPTDTNGEGSLNQTKSEPAAKGGESRHVSKLAPADRRGKALVSDADEERKGKSRGQRRAERLGEAYGAA